MTNMTLILTSVGMGAVGQVLLKAGADGLCGLKLDQRSLLALMTNVYILSGACLFGISFLLWIKVLTKNDLSYAYPMVSLSYIIVVIASRIFFNEAITMNKLIGIASIVIGITIINK